MPVPASTIRWRFSWNAFSMARAISYWPRLCSKASEDRESMPPGAKKSCREGRFSGGAGVIEMGAVVDNVWGRDWGSCGALSIIDSVANK